MAFDWWFIVVKGALHFTLSLSLSLFILRDTDWLFVLLLSALIFIKNSHIRLKLGMNETEGHTKREGERVCVCVSE